MGKTPQLEFILESLEQADTLVGLQEATEALQQNLEVDHIAYHWVDSAGDQYGCGTYSVAWQQRYIDQNYLRIDPVVIGCFQRFHPVDWKQLDWSSKAVRAFQLEAIEYGLGNQGYSIPVRGPNGQFALFTINHSCDDDAWAIFTQKHRRELILIAHFLNEKALEFEPGRTPDVGQALSPREVDAMTLLAIGYNRAQVADSLSISEHTLRVYIESARFKLGALNTTHAVARALSRGLIVV
ncbi:helix-turn-helix transcriptional regulator [Sulfitobacter geojensis]|uniref:Autoinducer binding domain-containing protein n=1 Tax=Sulfitobacter geojensis TaxID=1342299 RepID=A0AAE2VY06_9RHOB|nr:autoinducer binding domain-containing protein [Sulfitobacter geojensis]MBM1689096.1 autoinducer binding domain-containing protein [Sulfitobacter geojensis]MBM1693163.1 autoinducer binding domain-containing protein [Sulfitobacter geojensis]MBM1705329.1 autoinducer binding domain-containing protein [Sulfitobacter geojensis]MBM1709387.1 autoinducer binding domain-containing protein [Sulfitobacter geojensis]MBM1713452.1 autoinducer binding domain-containing protein [Sulfitobacter geojensis]